MNYKNIKNNNGFTLIETMIAVFILSVSLSLILSTIGSSLFSARYAKNDITANYLIQDVMDYIRNDRDTIAFQQKNDPQGGWNNFLNKYGYGRSSDCFSRFGCEIEPANINSLPNINQCSEAHTWGTIDCKVLQYDENASNQDFYTYLNVGVPSNFKRKVNMSINPNFNIGDQLDITVTVEWLNGNVVKSRTLRTSLLDWQK